LPDQTSCLKRPDDEANRGALDPKQPGQMFMGERQPIPFDLILHGQKPATASRLNSVNRIASHGLKRLGQQGFQEAKKQLSDPWSGVERVMQDVRTNP